MAFELKKQSLWHAFDALDVARKGMCSKSQLKVLTHNVASNLGIVDVEKKFDESTEENMLSFLDYSQFIQREVFNLLPVNNLSFCVDTKAPIFLKEKMDKIDEVSWFICGTKYNNRENKRIADDVSYELWQVFNIIADCDPDGTVCYPVTAHPQEVLLLMRKIVQNQVHSESGDSLEKIVLSRSQYLFSDLLELIEHGPTEKLSHESLEASIQEIHREYVTEVIKEGYLVKKGPPLANWKDRWFILTPHSLKYYTTRDLSDQKGQIIITNGCTVQGLSEKSGAHSNRFCLSTPVKTYEINAPDTKTQNEWISALEFALENCESLLPKERQLALVRQKEREARRNIEEQEAEKRRQEEQQRIDQENQRLAEEEQKLQQITQRLEEETAKRLAEEKQHLEEQQEKLHQLHLLSLEKQALIEEQERYKQLSEEQRLQDLQEKQEQLLLLSQQKERSEELLLKEQQARDDLEAKLLHEATLRQAELRRLKELQELKRQLEDLLEQERQAKKDEEIVRSLQARALEEEMLKRKEMENLQSELEENLREERERREGLDNKVQLDQDKLNKLEEERISIDQQLERALSKLKVAEKTRLDMQRKLYEKEQVKPIVSHRGLGAFPIVKRAVANNNVTDKKDDTATESSEREDVTTISDETEP